MDYNEIVDEMLSIMEADNRTTVNKLVELLVNKRIPSYQSGYIRGTYSSSISYYWMDNGVYFQYSKSSDHKYHGDIEHNANLSIEHIRLNRVFILSSDYLYYEKNPEGNDHMSSEMDQVALKYRRLFEDYRKEIAAQVEQPITKADDLGYLVYGSPSIYLMLDYQLGSDMDIAKSAAQTICDKQTEIYHRSTEIQDRRGSDRYFLQHFHSEAKAVGMDLFLTELQQRGLAMETLIKNGDREPLDTYIRLYESVYKDYGHPRGKELLYDYCRRLVSQQSPEKGAPPPPGGPGR